jgi:hypothetical protein
MPHDFAFILRVRSWHYIVGDTLIFLAVTPHVLPVHPRDKKFSLATPYLSLTICLHLTSHSLLFSLRAACAQSKSTGNFLMLLETVEEYSADATRFALADAGDRCVTLLTD